MASATITSKGQITIPLEFRKALGLKSGDRIDFIEKQHRQFSIKPATRSIKDLAGLLKDKNKRTKPVSIEEINEAIASMGAETE